MHFSASNNVAEYKALLHGLRITIALSIHWLRVLGDSLLVINQANKEWSCLHDKMMMYYQKLRKLENNFDGLEYHHILRGCNEVTDDLAKLGSSQATVPQGFSCRNSMSQASARHSPRSTKWSSDLRRLRHQPRAYPSHPTSRSSTRASMPYSWCTSGLGACLTIKTSLNNCIVWRVITL
jgi:ribonuclease HI